MKQKKIVIAGLVAGLVAGGGAGLVLTSGGFAGASAALPSAVVVDDADTGDRAAERGARLAEVLQPLVADGTLTQEQLDTVVETLMANAPERDGRGGRGGHGDHDGPRGGRGGHGLEAAATALGITADELRVALREGATLAEIAADEGVAVQTVIDAMVAELETRLDERVAAGDLTQEEADAKLAKATEKITDLVNNGRPDRGGEPAPADPSA
jgi:hypothetical protein